MKYSLILAAILVGFSQRSYGQADDKLLTLTLSLAQPVGDMKLSNNSSPGGSVTYDSPINESVRLSLRGGFYLWSEKGRFTSEDFSHYSLSIPISAGMDAFFSDNSAVPFVSLHAGLNMFWGYAHTYQPYGGASSIDNQIGFIVHPEIGWRLPFSTTQFLDLRGGFTYGTGEITSFTYVTVSLGFAFAL